MENPMQCLNIISVFKAFWENVRIQPSKTVNPPFPPHKWGIFKSYHRVSKLWS
jgi:hypothetical protein